MNRSLCNFSRSDISTFCACATCVCTWLLSSCGDWVCNLRGQFLLKIPVFPSLSFSSAGAAVGPRHWCLIIFLRLQDVELASLLCKLDVTKRLERVLWDFGGKCVSFQLNWKETGSTISQNLIMPLICLSSSYPLVDLFIYLGSLLTLSIDVVWKNPTQLPEKMLLEPQICWNAYIYVAASCFYRFNFQLTAGTMLCLSSG